jgi:MFS family permease
VSARAGLGWLLVQAALVHACYSVVKPMVSYRALDMGAGSFELGTLAAAFAVLPLVLAFAVGRRADALGPGRLLVAGSSLLAVGCAAALLADGLVLLLLASASLGFAFLLAMVGQQSVVATLASETDRDRGFGSLTAAASLGQMLGPPLALSLAGYLAADGPAVGVTGLAVAAALAFAALPFTAPRRVLRRPAVAGEQTTSRKAFSGLVRTDGMWQALVTSGLVLAALDLLMAFLPAWAEERGISVATVGWLLAVRAFVSLVSRVVVVRLVATFTRRATFLGSLVMGVAGLALLPFVDVGGAIGVMCLLGVGLGLGQPLTLSWVSSLAPPHARGAAIGLRITANRLAQTVLPPSIGLAAAGSGSSGVFLGTAVVLAGATATVLRQRMDPPGEAAQN